MTNNDIYVNLSICDNISCPRVHTFTCNSTHAYRYERLSKTMNANENSVHIFIFMLV